MLMGTYQPMATLKYVQGIDESCVKAGQIAQLEKSGELDQVWCFPASTWEEAFVHSLFTSPNCPQVFMLLDTENYRRIDKARHFAILTELREKGEMECPYEALDECEDKTCPDDRSELVLVSPEELHHAVMVYIFHPAFLDDEEFGHLLLRNEEKMGQMRLSQLPMEFKSLIDIANDRFGCAKSHFAEIKNMRPGDITELENMLPGEKCLFDNERVKFMFLYLPAIFDLKDGTTEVYLENSIPVTRCIDYIMDCHNRMCNWSYGKCDNETYAKIFADAMLPIQAAQYFDMHPSNKKLPGRNDPCPCGSGKKFKKCHAKIFG